ncbi:OmpA family protein [candidate division KSB1 bacterium]|nr:OmpA family protein [candidate division KSB1 bacterium]
MGKKSNTITYLVSGFFLLSFLTIGIFNEDLKAQTTAGTVANLLTEMDAKIAKAQSHQVNLLSPVEFRKVLENFERAKDDDAKGRNQKDILKRLQDAQKFLQNAEKTAEVSRMIFKDLLPARDSALDADAPQFAPEVFAQAEKVFEDAARNVEDGDTKSATKKAEQSLDLYQTAELKAIKENIIGKVHLLQKKAKEERVDRFAPKTFMKSQTLIQEAENILNTDRKKQSLARQKAQSAEYEANHAVYIARLAREFKEDDASWENLLLDQERLIQNIGKSANLENLRFDNGLSEATTQIVQVLESQRNNIQSLNEELKQKNQEMAERNKEVKELRGELNQLKQVSTDLKDELEAQKRKEEKLKRVEDMFSPAEAKVIREGNALKLRLISLTFKLGSDIIGTEHYGLLNKVQRCIRDFPEANVLIEGHTDTKGNPAKNMELSNRRAGAVKTYLQVNMGLTEDKIQAVGYGDSRPIAPNTTEDGRTQNRRIDIVIDLSKVTEY